MADESPWLSLPFDALWDIGAGLVDADITRLDEVVVDALAAASVSVDAVLAGAWRSDLSTGQRTTLFSWVDPAMQVTVSETENITNLRLLEAVEHGATVVPVADLADGDVGAEWVDGEAVVILIGRGSSTIDTVAFVRPSGGWTPAEVQRLSGFGAILRQFLARAEEQQDQNLRMQLRDFARSCVALMSSSTHHNYEERAKEVLAIVARRFDLETASVVAFGSSRATTEYFVGTPLPDDWLDVHIDGDGGFASVASGPRRHQLFDLAHAFFGDNDQLLAHAEGLEISLFPVAIEGSTPGLMALIGPTRTWNQHETESLQFVAHSLMGARARTSAQRWSAARLEIQREFAALAATFVRTPLADAEEAVINALDRLASVAESSSAILATVAGVDEPVTVWHEWTAERNELPMGAWTDRLAGEFRAPITQGEPTTSTEFLRSLDPSATPKNSAPDATFPWTMATVPITGSATEHVVGIAFPDQGPGRTEGVVDLLTAFADLAGQLLSRSELERRSRYDANVQSLLQSVFAQLTSASQESYPSALAGVLSDVRSFLDLERISILDLDPTADAFIVRHSSDSATVNTSQAVGVDPLIDGAGSLVPSNATLTSTDHACFATPQQHFGSISVLAAWGTLADGNAEQVLHRVAVVIAEVDRRLETERYGLAAFDQSPTGAVLCDEDATVLRCNRAFADFVGYESPEALIGVHRSQLCAASDELVAGTLEMDFTTSDGRTVLGLTTAIPLNERSLGEGVWLVHVEDITERRKAAKLLRFQADHDELTGLLNRRALTEQCEPTLAGAGSLGVLLLDLDRFKLINDSLGHDRGDELLVEVVRRMRQSLSAHDVVGRIGGDEFAIVVAGPTTLRSAQILAERLLLLIGEPFELGNQQVFPAASIGIAIADASSSFAELVQRADTAMYRAKAKGRNRHEIFDRELHDQIVARMATEAGLRRALKTDELLVHYQPEVSLIDNRLLGAEALVRWEHPDLGLLSAASFIDVAEDSGVVIELGTIVLHEACRSAASWSGPEPLTVRVNFSAAQLQRDDTVGLIQSALDQAGLPARQLCVEITESAMMIDAPRAERVLAGIKELGVVIAVDDFGTGFSSLAYLKRFPVDALKIDREFVQDLGTNEGRAFVQSIVSLADALGLEVVAEGVETQDQADVLLQLGCTRAQGYFFGRPSTEADLLARIAHATH